MKELELSKIGSRKDVAGVVLDMVRPLKPFYTGEQSGLIVGYTAAHYGSEPAKMEGWARVLWGLGPLFANNNDDLDEKMQTEIEQWKELYLTGLRNGTDPKSSGYWGDIGDYDQKMVESAAISAALCLSSKSLWNPLSDKEKNRIESWMRQINSHEVHANNWRFFRILTNMTFAVLGLEFDEKALVNDFSVVEKCYVDDGWYYDGHDGQMDYYIPFAMHFYGLIWAALAPDLTYGEAGEASKYFSKEYKVNLLERGRKFAGEYALWFSDDGAEVPFGRSLTYRFAHSAFWSALVFAEEKLKSYSETGKYKHLLLQNLRHWLKFPITDNAGILQIGYRYPNLIMSEKYNAPGSPYWAFKAFLILALSPDSMLWNSQEESFEYSEKEYLKSPHMIICHEKKGDKDHVTMFPSGQHAGMEHGNCDSKYKKLVYSNRFGFSVQRGNNLDDGAFDNVFVVSRHGEEKYYMTNCIRWEADEEKIHITSNPIDGVHVDTFVIPTGNGWHVRIHCIDTEIAIDTADGGFAMPVMVLSDGNKTEFYEENDARYMKSDFACVGAYTTDSNNEISFVRAFPNTNVMYPLTTIPYVKQSYGPGKYVQINAFYGTDTDVINEPPKISVGKDGIKIDSKYSKFCWLTE